MEATQLPGITLRRAILFRRIGPPPAAWRGSTGKSIHISLEIEHTGTGRCLPHTHTLT